MSDQSIPIPPRVKDLTGRTFGKLTVVGFAGMRHGVTAHWTYLCPCGGTSVASSSNLKRSEPSSTCGQCFQQPPSEHYYDWYRKFLVAHSTPVASGCWEWARSCQSQGYGQVRLHGKQTLAHIASHVVFIGPVPDGMFVLHKCDNPPCCNPAHLVAGTHDDNMKDMVSKGRHVHGEACRASKLRDQDVVAIRYLFANNNVSYKQLGIQFGVIERHIRNIISGRAWSHVPLSTVQKPG